MDNGKLLDWLKQDMEKMNEKIDNIEKNVEQILQFKWQVIGGSIALSVVFTIVVQVASLYIK